MPQAKSAVLENNNKKQTPKNHKAQHHLFLFNTLLSLNLNYS